MVTILAVLGITAVLFVAAALATAEQPLLADASPDRPDLRLPDGPMAPGDVDALRFPLAARGYRMDAVDEALARLRDELADRDRRLGLLDATVEGDTRGEATAPVDETGVLPTAAVEAVDPVAPPPPPLPEAPVQDPVPPAQAVVPGAVAPVLSDPPVDPPADLPPADLAAALVQEPQADQQAQQPAQQQRRDEPSPP